MKRQRRCWLLLLLLLATIAAAQNSNKISAVDSPVASGANNQVPFNAIIATTNPLLTDQDITVNAGCAAVCGDTTVYLDSEQGTGVCSPTINYTSAPYGTGHGVTYSPPGLDGIVNQYKTAFLFQVASEGAVSNVTANCVFSQAQANASALSWTASTAYSPGEYICVAAGVPTAGACGGTYWQIQTGCYVSVYSSAGYNNTCISKTGAHPTFTGSSVTDNQITWISVGANAPLQDGFCGSAHTCVSAGDSSSCYVKNGSAAIVINANNLGPCTLAELYVSEPVDYELPMRQWMFSVMSSFIAHYNTTSFPNVDYMRSGQPGGGEFSVAGDAQPVYPWAGNGTGYPNACGGGGHTPCNQFRAQWISWVNKFDAQIMSYSPTFNILSDMNCVGDPQDCSFADQEALAAYNSGMWGIGNQDYNINDMDNLGLTGTTGSSPCLFNSGNPNPLVAGSGCTEGDWAYNFAQYPSMAHQLQSFGSGTTPLYCPAGNSAAGPISALPAGSTYCNGVYDSTANGTIGLVQSLINLCNTGTGSPNVQICVNVLEMHTGFSDGTVPTVGVSDTLLALSANYGSTVGAIAAYVPSHAAYAAAFCTFLGFTDCAGSTTLSGVTLKGVVIH